MKRNRVQVVIPKKATMGDLLDYLPYDARLVDAFHPHGEPNRLILELEAECFLPELEPGHGMPRVMLRNVRKCIKAS